MINIKSTLKNLIDRLEKKDFVDSKIIPWGSPVPMFGRLSSQIATLGLNPSNREFVDSDGVELDGSLRRFHTLKSLNLSKWEDVQSKHVHMILKSCDEYFHNNPYDTWFKELDAIICGSGASYYNSHASACHLDLIPYATSCKWTELSKAEQRHLLQQTGDTLGLLLKDSLITTLVLNGKTVVENLEAISGVGFSQKTMSAWTLPRQSGQGVSGIAYEGFIRELGGISLGRNIQILGFNHNIQSSYGVTKLVKKSIGHWIEENIVRKDFH